MDPAGERCGTVVGAAAAIREGETTSVALVEAMLAAAGRHEALAGYITVAAEQALAAAREADRTDPLGPLHGVPLVIKDNIHVVGLPNTAGSPALTELIAPDDAPVITRLRRAGAIVLGKTNMHELAFGITSNNAAFGSVRNARDSERFAGGSSGGTAALVAAGAAPAGLGTDTGGSVRIPAALNGVWGLRPTVGRYPAGGVTPLSSSRDTVGPIARTLDDLVLLDAVLAGEPAATTPVMPAELKLGIPSRHFTEPLDPEAAEVWAQAKADLAAAGVELVTIDVEEIVALDAAISLELVLHETARELSAYLEHYLPGLSLDRLISAIASPDVHEIFRQGVAGGSRAAPGVEIYERDLLPARARLQRAYAAVFADGALDAIAFPTTPLPAQPIATSTEQVDLAGAVVGTFEAFTRSTGPGSLAGIPGITVPGGFTRSGLPVGLALDAPAGADRRLLAVARVVAVAAGYGDRLS